jgi:hypothetical protein
MKTTTKTSKRTPKAPIFAPSILAIDLGKYKSVACALDTESGEFRRVGQVFAAHLYSRRWVAKTWPTKPS